MRYQITEQYQRGEERFIAEFSHYDAWRIFSEARINEDGAQKRAILYRLYENSELIEMVNPAQLCITTAGYADGGRLIEVSPPLVYRLVLKTQELELNEACFDYYTDVKLFLLERCRYHHGLRPEDVFCLFKHQTLIETFPAHQIQAWSSSDTHPLSASFNPTPTPITPKPPGFPQNHWREDEDTKN